MEISKQTGIRKTNQYELPVVKENSVDRYDIYPTHNIGTNKIFRGYYSLSEELSSFDYIKIDGFIGILFEEVKEKLNEAFTKKGIYPRWVNVKEAIKEESVINDLINPFLGGDDPVFGKLAELDLDDLFDKKKLEVLASENTLSPVIFYGIGACLIPKKGKTVYFEVSKNEIQFRSRAGSIMNLGATKADDPKKMYKRFYFVDWVILNRHKNFIKEEIDYLVDGQRAHDITWIRGNVWRESFKKLIKSPIRVRPWFEPGAWGGHWIREKIDGIEKNVINYAWSFELIVPENGIIIESSGLMLEYSFDFLMFYAGKEVLGKDFKVYRYYFPIRFDFLDTFDGGNLSIQCHPQKAYMEKHFGEDITQEETYYILDTKNDAKVYLGFQEGVTPEAFREALDKSQQEKQELAIDKFVRSFDSHKHDLFLIPPGTIHSSGIDNLVLEISSTPYIYTFKMYDWLRLDLDDNPRPLNIDRGMDNLVFDRAGDRVENELIAKSKLIECNENWKLEHLATHREHLYDIHRFRIMTEVTVNTSEKVHVLSLVEGEKIRVTTENNSTDFSYAETFIIPAVTGEYTIENLTKEPVMVVKAFIK